MSSAATSTSPGAVARPADDRRSRECLICSSAVTPFGQTRVLGKIPVSYFRCGTCGFLQTETPHWLEAAYSQAIGSTDVGLVLRNEALVPRVKATIETFFNPKGAFLDYGGGYGLLVRMMRDRGYRFFRSDAYCENIFAQGFDLEEQTERRFELVCAFEVVEHLVDPIAELQKMLQFAPAVLFSTLPVPTPAPALGSWWYYALEHGQHISLFTEQSLKALGHALGGQVVSAGELHLFTRERISPALFRAVTRNRVARVLSRLWRRPSLLEADYSAAVGRANRGSASVVRER